MVSDIVVFNLKNKKEFKAALEITKNKIGNLEIPLRESSRDVFKNTKPKFNFTGNGFYKPLSDDYKTYKDRVRPGAKILNFDGDLKKSVTPGGSQDTILRIGKKTAVMGSKLPYARAINDGYEPRNLPARPFLFFDPAQEIRINRIFGDFIAAKLEALGRVSNG